jgi:hypothetical protein
MLAYNLAFNEFFPRSKFTAKIDKDKVKEHLDYNFKILVHHLKNPDHKRSDIFLLDSVPPYSDITKLLNAHHKNHNKLKIGVCASHAGTSKAIPL